MYFEQLNPDNCKSYLLFNEKSRSAIIIDPKLDYTEAYMKRLEEKGAKLNLVIDTHTHLDHISGAKYLKEKTNCKYAMHERSENNEVDVKLKNNDILDIDGITFKVIYTPGHTKDSICVAWQDKLFTGDVLFLNKGIGRTDLESTSVDKYWESLLRIKGLDKDFIVCPAHIYDNTSYSTIESQKKNNGYLRLRSKKEFKERIEKNKLEINSEMINIGECKLISCYEFKNKLSKNNICILDVRSMEEIADDQSNIIGTINISLMDLSCNLYKLDKYIDEEIIIICRQGKKSREAYELLRKVGFKKISILQGGLSQFKETFEFEF